MAGISSTTSSTSYNRITGLATGLDTDSMVKQMMQPYVTKVNQAKQSRDLLIFKQDMYRDVIKDLRGLFSKYTDITKTDSLLLSKNYSTSVFKSSSEAVKAEGLSGAKVGNYKVQVNKLAEPARVEIDNISSLKGNVININVNGKLADVDLTDATDSDIVSKINSSMKNTGLTAKLTKSDLTGKLIFETNSTGSTQSITINGAKSTTTTMDLALNDVQGKSLKFNINGTEVIVDFSDINNETDALERLNETLSGKGITASGDGIGGLKLTSTIESTTNVITLTDDQNVAIDYTTNSSINTNILSEVGKKSNVTITDSFGNTATKEYDSNQFNVDNVKFTISDVTSSAVGVNGSTDVTELKDKLKEFVNSFNEVVGKITTKLNEKKNYSYTPLTDEQREEMTDEEIEKWESKVKLGILKNDNDLTNMVSQLRSAFSTPLQGNSLTLRKLGIDFSNDITKNNQLVVDEEKLTKALEENPEEVLKLFTQTAPSSSTTKEDIHKNSGIMQRIKSVLDSTVMNSGSNFIKKVGYEGTSTFTKNDITDDLLKRERKIADMENSLMDRENKFYAKFAVLEKSMNNYNAQSSWLMQQFG